MVKCLQILPNNKIHYSVSLSVSKGKFKIKKVKKIDHRTLLRLQGFDHCASDD